MPTTLKFRIWTLVYQDYCFTSMFKRSDRVGSKWKVRRPTLLGAVLKIEKCSKTTPVIFLTLLGAGLKIPMKSAVRRPVIYPLWPDTLCSTATGELRQQIENCNHLILQRCCCCWCCSVEEVGGKERLKGLHTTSYSITSSSTTTNTKEVPTTTSPCNTLRIC